MQCIAFLFAPKAFYAFLYEALRRACDEGDAFSNKVSVSASPCGRPSNVSGAVTTICAALLQIWRFMPVVIMLLLFF